jgi:catechol 2,3-dioxygenase-like lactoylglutathione lyase family enzyme
MTLRIRTVTFDCADHVAMVDFWSKVTGFGEDPENPNNPGDPEGLLVSPDRSLALLFIPVPEPKTVKNRVHFDLAPVGTTRDFEVDRLLQLGASLVADHREADASGWVTLADPEGNELCVERSEAERTP